LQKLYRLAWIQTAPGATVAAPAAGYRPLMNQPTSQQSESDPDGDPEMKQTASQPDQAEGSDDPAETGSE
jgi:hypothetical protein